MNYERAIKKLDDQVGHLFKIIATLFLGMSALEDRIKALEAKQGKDCQGSEG